jgi:hypothetical protein
VQVHPTVPGGELRADDAASPRCRLKPGVQMEMPDGFGKMIVASCTSP